MAPPSTAGDLQNAPRRPAAARRRFGSPLILSRVHWVRPELVAEVKYLTWTEDNLLRQVVYEGLREDKPAAEVRRPVPHPKPAEPVRPLPAQNGLGPADRRRRPAPPDFISRPDTQLRTPAKRARVRLLSLRPPGP